MRAAGLLQRTDIGDDARGLASFAADTHTELEPSRFLRNDNKRPDGAMLTPGPERGTWDFTRPDTLAPSHLPRSSTAQGRQLSWQRARKKPSTSNSQSWETLGARGPSALDITAEISR